ncbi:MAG: hypothetical protein HY880_03900, partial [Deltaproteobacteria bacterium]|nr:hypothetical protein [Deltaproteobacteria bacterium]
MKMVVQNYANGALELLDVPSYKEAGGSVLVETHASVVSAGTERAMIEMARKSLLAKATARPDWVAEVIA